MAISNLSLARPMPLKGAPKSPEQHVESARDLKDAYTDFVGKTFFGQMMKAMRSTVDKPAYFHGGQGEEVFSSQLDQQMADMMSDATASQIADPIFARQFPHQAKLLADAEKAEASTTASVSDLAGLRRR